MAGRTDVTLPWMLPAIFAALLGGVAIAVQPGVPRFAQRIAGR